MKVRSQLAAIALRGGGTRTGEARPRRLPPPPQGRREAAPAPPWRPRPAPHPHPARAHVAPRSRCACPGPAAPVTRRSARGAPLPTRRRPRRSPGQGPQAAAPGNEAARPPSGAQRWRGPRPLGLPSRRGPERNGRARPSPHLAGAPAATTTRPAAAEEKGGGGGRSPDPPPCAEEEPPVLRCLGAGLAGLAARFGGRPPTPASPRGRGPGWAVGRCRWGWGLLCQRPAGRGPAAADPPPRLAPGPAAGRSPGWHSCRPGCAERPEAPVAFASSKAALEGY